MKSTLLRRLGAALSLAVVSSGAYAATAVTVSTLNLRAGPAQGYPVLVTLPVAAEVTSHGCLADMSWCDVSWGGQRGWVASSYIRVVYHAQPVVVTATSAPIIGMPVVAFNYGYWQRYYVDRPWFGSWHVYAPTVVPVVHRGVTGCGPRGCVHVGSTYVPPSRPARVTVIRH